MNQVIAEVKRVINDNGLAQAAVATEAGISAATLSTVLNGTYTGRVDRITRKLEVWLSRNQQTENIKAATSLSGLVKPSFFRMKSSQTVLASLALAHSMNAITMMFGGPGIGKTEAALRYQEDNPNVTLITVSRASGTLTAVLNKLLNGLGLPRKRRTAAQLEDELRQKLTGMRGLIIVDEAQYLSGSALQELRIICENICGIALIGNGEIRDRMTSIRTRDEMEPVWSRVIRAVDMCNISEDDAESYIRAWGFTDEDCISRLKEHCLQANGALRATDFIIQMASEFASHDAEEVSIRHIELAWQQVRTAQCDERVETARRNPRIRK